MHNSADSSEGTDDNEQLRGIDFGDDDPDELRTTLKERLKEAVDAGISRNGEKRLHELMETYCDIFRLGLGRGPPAKVPGMKIQLKENVNSLRVKSRGNPPKQREFINNYIDELVNVGVLEDRPMAEWQAVPLLVLKPGSKDEYRMTIDPRPRNAAIKKESWPLIHIDPEVQDFSGDSYFPLMGFIAAYWQIAMHPASVDLVGIVTPNRVLGSKRVLQGLANSVIHFHLSVEPKFARIRDKSRHILMTLLPIAKQRNNFWIHWKHFFRPVGNAIYSYRPGSAIFFLRQVKWCGRLIDGPGYSLDLQLYEENCKP